MWTECSRRRYVQLVVQFMKVGFGYSLLCFFSLGLVAEWTKLDSFWEGQVDKL